MEDFPTPLEVYENYQFLCRALMAAEQDVEDFDARLQQQFEDARLELDQAFTLTLFASVEAAVRIHFTQCLKDGEPAWLAVPARALNSRSDERPHFEDVLDLWKLSPDAPPAAGDALG